MFVPFTFVCFCEQAVFPEPSEDFSDMLTMFFRAIGIDQYVVQIDYNTLVQ